MHILLDKKDDFSLTVRMERFSHEDIQAIKLLKNRKWLPEERVWTIPYTISSLDDLWEVMGSRSETIDVSLSLLTECPYIQDKLDEWHA